MKDTFSKELINWYKTNKRELPWRETTNPYYIWLSEIILQQTQVKQGLPYYLNFVKHYPVIQDLANADEQEVLKLWQGLGYYSRGRNLHATAQHIVNNLGGQFPSTYEQLIKLKGVGDYTASAIASFCFDANTPTIDGNVYRVLSRIFGIKTPINTPKAQKEFKKLAFDLIDKNQPAVFNQAIMEFGALHCTPKQPKCKACMFASFCYAFEKKEVNKLPFKTKKNKTRKRYFNYIVLQTSDKSTYIRQRKGKDIWENLYEFPLIETEKEIDYKTLTRKQEFIDLTQNSGFELKLYSPKSLVHKLSHQHLYIRFWLLKLNSFSKTTQTWEQIKDYPFPIVIYNFISNYRNS